jgi:ABC-type dipeptide/oligopeptide/nickel transport system permease component
MGRAAHRQVRRLDRRPARRRRLRHLPQALSPATIELSAFAIILAVVIAIPMGYVAAKRRGSAVDNAGIVTSLVGVAIPVFFLAFLLKYFFAIKLGWLLPVVGATGQHQLPPG